MEKGKRNKRVFISGPITGEVEYCRKFMKAQGLLKIKGYEAINPGAISWFCLPQDLPWDAYMELFLPLLKYCDAIYSLAGWEQSAGARIEREYAARLGLELMEEDTDD